METQVKSVSYYKPATESATRNCGSNSFSPSSSNIVDMEKVALGVRMILEGLGEDTEREGLLDTPARVARMYQELVYGLNIDPASEITCTFNETSEDFVLVKDIAFSSVCEHHMLPFFGTASIAYIPAEGKITGLSKLARLVELTSRKLQVQERMTSQIADAICQRLSPLGVLVMLEAEHMCMSVRGIKKPGSKTITTATRGVLKTNASNRQELMSLLTRT